MDAENPRAVVGGNAPPAPTPYESSLEEIETLWIEAENFLDGEPIANQEQADAVAKLLDMARQAFATADGRRKDEVKPLDDAKKEVQDRYHPLIGDTKAGKGKAVLIAEACKAATTVWLIKLDDEKRKVAAEAAKVADEARKAAEAAFATSHSDDVMSRARAENLAVQADAADRAATRAGNDKAQAKGGARAVSLRARHVASLTDGKAALRHAEEFWGDDLRAWLVERAQKDVQRGIRTIAGFTIAEVRSAA